MTVKRILIAMLMMLVVVFAACTPAQPEPGAAPANDEAEQVAPEALPAARLALAEYLAVSPDALELEQIEDAQWPNACLGLAEPGEMCAEVITDGFLITFTYESESYGVRTDLSGNAVRVEAAATAEPTGDELPPPVIAARATLARELGLEAEDVEIVSFEQQEWSDSCLGLGGPAESCLAAITPGWQVMLGVEGEVYEVRTDMSGESVRIAGDTGQPVGDQLPPPVTAARAALSRELGVEEEGVEIVSFEQQEWSDSCLGLGGPAESCLAVITPGWQVMLGAEGEVYEVRTDMSGESVRIAGTQAQRPAGEIPGPDLNGAVLFYQRSGGISGDLLTVRVYPDGTVERVAGPPEPDTAMEMVPVDPAAVETLLADLEAAGFFGLERSYLPEDTCCDRFLYLISAERNGEVQTVEALDATPEVPQAVGESVALIEAFIAESFGE